ncbi:hypothetical protein [Streptomyces collinus]|uniref:hypothetical protein n=1 Tax=Streptomyces collinus TaxID=42684 RepID=UPI0033C64696
MANKNFSVDKRAIEKTLKDLARGYEQAARKHPIRVPVQAEAAVGLPDGEGGVLEEDLHLAKLLLWLNDMAASGYVDVSRFAPDEGLTEEEAEVLALALEQAGFIKALRTFGGGTPIMLSNEGRVEVRRLRRLQQDGAARLRYTIDALIKWLFVVPPDQAPVEPVRFLTTPLAYFAGAPLSAEDLDRALGHLVQRQLVECIDSTPPTVVLTSDGADRVLSGGSVTSLPHSSRSGDSYTFNNSSNIVAGSQQHFVQNNTSGLDAAALSEFAAAVKQFAPVLGLNADQQTELIEDAEVLSDETTGESVEPGRIRAAYDRVRARLDGVTTVTAGLTTLIAQGEAAYHSVFGG